MTQESARPADERSSDVRISDVRIYFLERQEITLSGFDAPGYILDIGGGGEGVIGQLMGERVIAIDPMQAELEEAPEGPLKIIMDACDLKFLDNTFPTVTAFFALMFMQSEEHRRAFREILRVLAPGGRFLIWDAALPTRLDPEKEVVAFRLTVHLPHKELTIGYGTRWPQQEQNLEYYSRLAEEVGFKVLRQEQQDRLFCLELEKPQKTAL
jgi:SAM-dependent methyltransferase